MSPEIISAALKHYQRFFRESRKRREAAAKPDRKE